jgi:hypothetical protein
LAPSGFGLIGSGAFSPVMVSNRARLRGAASDLVPSSSSSPEALQFLPKLIAANKPKKLN